MRGRENKSVANAAETRVFVAQLPKPNSGREAVLAARERKAKPSFPGLGPADKRVVAWGSAFAFGLRLSCLRFR